MFKGITQDEFNTYFQSENDCRRYLYDIKWKNGFVCKCCGYTECWKGRTRFHTRCINCDYEESITAHTFFHKVQISLLKAFWITFYVAVLKKGMSTVELGKLNNVNQKTAWRFKRRIQEAMSSWILKQFENWQSEKFSPVDGVILTHRGKNLNGIQQSTLISQKCGGEKGKHKIIRIKRVQSSLEALHPCELIGGKYVGEGKDILIWNLRGWLTGTHHHCSEKYFEGYLNEFSFRYNLRGKQDEIWHRLIEAMMSAKPQFTGSNGASWDNRVD